MYHNFNESAVFTLDMSFKDFIRKKRRLMGLNQTDFGYLVGVNQGTVSMWELGVTSPPIDTAAEIIEKLGGKIRIVNHHNVDIEEWDNPLGFNPYQE